MKQWKDCFDYALDWQRNLVECLFSALKRLFGTSLSSLSAKTQRAELYMRLIAYNLGYFIWLFLLSLAFGKIDKGWLFFTISTSSSFKSPPSLRFQIVKHSRVCRWNLEVGQSNTISCNNFQGLKKGWGGRKQKAYFFDVLIGLLNSQNSLKYSLKEFAISSLIISIAIGFLLAIAIITVSA